MKFPAGHGQARTVIEIALVEPERSCFLYIYQVYDDEVRVFGGAVKSPVRFEAARADTQLG